MMSLKKLRHIRTLEGKGKRKETKPSRGTYFQTRGCRHVKNFQQGSPVLGLVDAGWTEGCEKSGTGDEERLERKEGY
jgi:hypothetical protein